MPLMSNLSTQLRGIELSGLAIFEGVAVAHEINIAFFSFLVNRRTDAHSKND